MNKQELEKFYTKQDPWGFKTHPDDKMRRDKIIDALKEFKGGFKRALDLGAGEGFITEKLPAEEIHAYEISDTACNRLPKNVKRVTKIEGKYDLIIATGVLYQQYDYKSLIDIILKHANGLVLTCHIKNLEVNTLPKDKMCYNEEFKYREYTQNLVGYSFQEREPIKIGMDDPNDARKPLKVKKPIIKKKKDVLSTTQPKKRTKKSVIKRSK